MLDLGEEMFIIKKSVVLFLVLSQVTCAFSRPEHPSDWSFKGYPPIFHQKPAKESVAEKDRKRCSGRFYCGALDSSTPAECISFKRVCDGISDCYNKMDEMSCPPKCSQSGEMMCDNRMTCGKKCDGHWDCPKGEDEKWCPSGCKCKPGFYQCKNGKKCLPFSMLCNGVNDCHDYDDQIQCPLKCECGPGEYQCLDGTCISNTKVCDNNDDCNHKDDESECASGCKCTPGQYLCRGKEGKCINMDQFCDDMEDCEEGEDEDRRQRRRRFRRGTQITTPRPRDDDDSGVCEGRFRRGKAGKG